ncbi:uncharacterized protein LOC114745116 [Neltuma alba]|uniref:uncharacterized protein LOC114745116 n=1 Tax=Neltuma alba TaxID=207710 RepID=UPI0010A39E63|nr:uncharacterized protein LOC114745116 [Prosopis alba]
MTSLEKLRSDAMRGKWSEAFETFKKERDLRIAEITIAGDTVLHMVVSNGEEKVVADMVDLLVQEDDEESVNKHAVLGAGNKRKNTPLHIAASMGKVEMCKKIGRENPFLLGSRNIAGETPLFLAALNGKKKTFLWLHYLYVHRFGDSSANVAHCIRDNKDTILHCAVAEGHFDVAVEIIYLYKDLVKATRFNHEGLSPLHLLAAMPSAFKSSSLFHRPFIEYLIYHLLPIREKKEATKRPDLEEEQKSSKVSDAIFKLIDGGWRKLNGIRKKKETHKLSVQIMIALLEDAYKSATGTPLGKTPTFTESRPMVKNGQEKIESGPMGENGQKKIETPLMIAAKNGVKEMVEKILELFPSTIEDVNHEEKNIVLLAAENRQTKVYQFLCEKKILNENLFRQGDKEGNSALHLAARLGDEPWLIPGEALQMQWEIKWFNFVKDSAPADVFAGYNKKFETPDDIFRETHKNLVTSGGKWLSKTSQACSVVSTLIATVAFSTNSNVPPVFLEPTNENRTGYKWFSSSSLVALCFSLISTFLFLSILTSRYQPIDFHMELPRRLIFGMTSLFLAIANIWLSFCVCHAFLLEQHIHRSYPIVYIISSLVVTAFVLEQFPLYFDLITANFTRVPSPSHKATPAIEYRVSKKKEEKFPAIEYEASKKKEENKGATD